MCFDELTGKHSMETVSPGLCWGGDGGTSSGERSGETGMNGFRWSHGGQETIRSMKAQGWQRRQKRELCRLKKDGKEWGEIGQIHSAISPIANKVWEQSLALTFGRGGISSAQKVTFLSQVIKLYSKVHKE